MFKIWKLDPFRDFCRCWLTRRVSTFVPLFSTAKSSSTSSGSKGFKRGQEPPWSQSPPSKCLGDCVRKILIPPGRKLLSMNDIMFFKTISRPASAVFGGNIGTPFSKKSMGDLTGSNFEGAHHQCPVFSIKTSWKLGASAQLPSGTSTSTL
uniref:Uncharacterized protein n=1 Tax=Opuntia streptacantha TaxID=393608 RepID=A0A7C9AZP1_OPUST